MSTPAFPVVCASRRQVSLGARQRMEKDYPLEIVCVK